MNLVLKKKKKHDSMNVNHSINMNMACLINTECMI